MTATEPVDVPENAPLTLISRRALGGNPPASRGRRSLKRGLERLLSK